MCEHNCFIHIAIVDIFSVPGNSKWPNSPAYVQAIFSCQKSAIFLNERASHRVVEAMHCAAFGNWQIYLLGADFFHFRPKYANSARNNASNASACNSGCFVLNCVRAVHGKRCWCWRFDGFPFWANGVFRKLPQRHWRILQTKHGTARSWRKKC